MVIQIVFGAHVASVSVLANAMASGRNYHQSLIVVFSDSDIIIVVLDDSDVLLLLLFQ